MNRERQSGFNRGFPIVLVYVALLGIRCYPAHANPGDLDPSFGGFSHDGIATQYGYPMDSYDRRGMAVQPDGKVVTAGYTGQGILVMRFLPNGFPDPTFGDSGVAMLQHATIQTRATCVALQSDGKIVVAGWADTNPANYMLARLLPNGQLDASFGSGFVFTDFSNDTDQAYGVVIQADGKIIAAGRSLVGGDYDFSAARYNPDGSLDTSFNLDGRITFGYGAGGDDANEACYAIALDGSGRLVMAGGSTDGSISNQFKVARLTTAGVLDPTFNGTGKLHFGMGEYHSAANAVAITWDGKIVVAGSYYFHSPFPGQNQGYVARILPYGALDSSLDGDGKATVLDALYIWGVIAQPDGKIVVLGNIADSASESTIYLVGLNYDGSHDVTFGSSNGEVAFALGGYCAGDALARQPDGRLLIYGAQGQNHVLIRIWPDARLDTDGTQAVGFDMPGFGVGTYAIGNGQAVQTDGKIIVAGTVYGFLEPAADFGLARADPSGSPDDSFGTHGRATFPFDQDDFGACVALQDDGKIVMAGDTQTGSDRDFMVVRFNADGSIDGSFGFLGVAMLDFLGGDDYGRAVAIAPDGKIVVAGTVFNGVRNVFGVARFNSNGTPDTTFDLDGKQLVEFSIGPTHWASSVAVLPDGRILEGGSVGGDFALLRLNVNGSLDTTFGSAFGGSGHRTYDFGGDDYLNALTLGPGNSIYAAGSRTIGGHSVFALLQLPQHGGPPVCFPNPCPWPDGQAIVDWGASLDAAAYAIDLRDDGQVLAGGIAGANLAWAQVSASSTPVPIYATASFPGTSDTATGISFTNDGKVIATGYYNWNGAKAMALARFYTTGGEVGVEDGDVAVNPGSLRRISTYPNPTTGRATIAFDLPGGARTTVSIYDLAGHRVRMLFDEPLPAGRHEMVWDTNDRRGRPVAAGIYLVRVDSGARHVEQKVMVLSR